MEPFSVLEEAAAAPAAAYYSVTAEGVVTSIPPDWRAELCRYSDQDIVAAVPVTSDPARAAATMCVSVGLTSRPLLLVLTAGEEAEERLVLAADEAVASWLASFVAAGGLHGLAWEQSLVAGPGYGVGVMGAVALVSNLPVCTSSTVVVDLTSATLAATRKVAEYAVQRRVCEMLLETGDLLARRRRGDSQ